MSMIKCVLPVLEMSCAVCANNVETTVKNLRGVQSAVVNFATENLLLTYDPAIITLEEIAAAVEAAGYGLVVGEEEKEKQREAAATRHFKSLRNRVVVAWLFALPLMAVSMGCMHTPHIEWLLLALTLPVILYSGRDFYVHAWKQLCQRTANMDTLVALSTGVAFLFSLAMTLFPQYWKSQGIAPQVYYDAAGMIIAFVLTGKLMEERAKHNTSAALKSLMGLQPQTAMKITADGMCEVNIATLKTGDRILVRPGEKVAVDGRVVEGESYVDESMINGEPIPADKTTGDTVMAGTINRDGVLTVEAQAVGAQTVLAHIVRRVQEAQGSKAPAQRLADRVSRRFVPAIIILACLTFVGWQCFRCWSSPAPVRWDWPLRPLSWWASAKRPANTFSSKTPSHSKRWGKSTAWSSTRPARSHRAAPKSSMPCGSAPRSDMPPRSRVPRNNRSTRWPKPSPLIGAAMPGKRLLPSSGMNSCRARASSLKCRARHCASATGHS